MSDTEPQRLLAPGEAAVILGVDPKTVTRWARAGKLTSTRTLGGHRRYKATDVYAIRDRKDDTVTTEETE